MTKAKTKNLFSPNDRQKPFGFFIQSCFCGGAYGARYRGKGEMQERKFEI